MEIVPKEVMTDLFRSLREPMRNLLPMDGIVMYLGPIFNSEEADRHMSMLLGSIAWKHDEVLIFGKRIVTRRQVAWYADAAFSYTYSNVRRIALPWSVDILALKSRVEQVSGESFNSCLLNLYQDGSVGMGWHSDAERDLVKDGAIASLSFGAERSFNFRHRNANRKLSISLEHGSLLVMKGQTQSHWHHCLPRSAGIVTPRINLTFRKYASSTNRT